MGIIRKNIINFSDIEANLKKKGVNVLFEQTLTMEDSLWFVSKEDSLAKEQYRETLKKALPLLALAWQELSFRQKAILYLVYVKRVSQKEIGEVLHIHQPTVSKLKESALKRLRRTVLGKDTTL